MSLTFPELKEPYEWSWGMISYTDPVMHVIRLVERNSGGVVVKTWASKSIDLTAGPLTQQAIDHVCAELKKEAFEKINQHRTVGDNEALLRQAIGEARN